MFVFAFYVLIVLFSSGFKMATGLVDGDYAKSSLAK
jgi:hypothetical protein